MFDNILVVCIGNICRSPTAERLLRLHYPEKMISSAGIAALEGQPADSTASLVAAAHGVLLDGHIARQLTHQLCQDADLILVMEKEHISAVHYIAPSVRGKILLFGHWLAQHEITDAYGMSKDAHEYIYQSLARAADSWVGKL